MEWRETLQETAREVLQKLYELIGKLREIWQEKPAVCLAVGASVLVVVILVVILSMMGKQRPPSDDVWYYDIASGKLFPDKNDIPPVNSPSDSDGVRAMIYSCGACEPGQWTVAYLETHTLDAKNALSKPLAPDATKEAREARDKAMTSGRLLALPPDPGSKEKPAWVPSDAKGAKDILARVPTSCPDPKKKPLECKPTAIY